jgi:hypothetical protein
MNVVRLDFAVFSVLVSVLVFGIWSNIEVYIEKYGQMKRRCYSTAIRPSHGFNS